MIDGATSVFRVDVVTDEATLLAGDGRYADLCPTPDGQTLYALCARDDRPPFVARLDAHAAGQTAVVLPFPGRSRRSCPARASSSAS